MPRARTRQLNLNNADVDVVENAHWGIARDDFAIYRKVIRREMLWDWWPQEVSEKLQQFYQDLKDGKRPKVADHGPAAARQVHRRHRLHHLGGWQKPGPENHLCFVQRSVG